jgi:hypothetical protein
MKFLLPTCALFLALVEASAPQAAVPYFSRVREVAVSAPERQNYVVLDEQVWKFARPDLGDLRLYADGREHAYALAVQKPSATQADRAAKVQKAIWTELSAQQPRIEQASRTTVITWEADENVPVERIAFTVDAAEVNFRRAIEISTFSREEKRELPLANGAISRVQMRRGNRKVDSEELAIELSARASNYKVTIHNGDDPPLRISKVRPLAMERRVYFDPKGATAFRLYYGDSKLRTASYDYAKFFQPDAAAARAQLGPETRNAAYIGRPDERPWSDRHPWVLWAALLVAVAGLGSIALRGLKS